MKAGRVFLILSAALLAVAAGVSAPSPAPVDGYVQDGPQNAPIEVGASGNRVDGVTL